MAVIKTMICSCNTLVFLALCKLYLSEGYKIPKVWVKYSVYATVHSMASISKSNMLSYKRQMKDYIHGKFMLSATCNSITKLLYTLEQHKEMHVCETFSDEYSLMWTKTTNVENSVTMNRNKPIGQECIRVMYTLHKNISIYLSFHNGINNKNINKLRYTFEMNKSLGLNITYLTFLLTDICFPEHPYDYPHQTEPVLNCFHHKDTEFVLIHQSEKHPSKKLFFCGKRPRFSIYVQHLVYIDYHICNVCLALESNIVFMSWPENQGILFFIFLKHCK